MSSCIVPSLKVSSFTVVNFLKAWKSVLAHNWCPETLFIDPSRAPVAGSRAGRRCRARAAMETDLSVGLGTGAKLRAAAADLARAHARVEHLRGSTASERSVESIGPRPEHL